MKSSEDWGVPWKNKKAGKMRFPDKSADENMAIMLNNVDEYLCSCSIGKFCECCLGSFPYRLKFAFLSFLSKVKFGVKSFFKSIKCKFKGAVYWLIRNE